MSKLVDLLKVATPVDTGEARDNWRATKNRIENDVEHIGALNKGSSTQAPKHFIETTVLSQKGVSPNGFIVSDK